MRKAYGNSWWGQQWLNALSDIDYSNRLPRGRTYANKGLAHDILIKGNEITAKVQGTRRHPYQVQFTIPAFSAREKAAIIELLTANPLLLSKLLNRRLPHELMDLCDQQDIGLFPVSWDDLEGSCSCPDWAVPCKHMAAVLYLVANEIDKNPFLVFELHDFDLFAGLAKIGYSAEGQKEIAILSTAALEQEFTATAVEANWEEEVYQQLDFSRIPEMQDDLSTILSDKPVFFPHSDFKVILQRAYVAAAKKVTGIVRSEREPISITSVDQIEDVSILLNEEKQFLNASLLDKDGDVVQSFDRRNEFVDWIQAIPISGFAQYAPTVKSLYLLQQFARKLVEKSALVPQLLRLNASHYIIRWLPALLNPVVLNIFTGVKSIVSKELLFYKNGSDINEPIEAEKTLALLSFFLGDLTKRYHGQDSRYREHAIGHLFFNGAVLAFSTYETKENPAAIQLWLNKFFIVEKDFVPVVQVTEEDGMGFGVTIAIQRQNERLSTPIPLKRILAAKKYLSIRMDVLRDLAMLSDYFPQLSQLVASKGKIPLYFDSDEFVGVLFKILPTIRLFGIKVLLPKALRKLLRPRLSMAVVTEGESGTVASTSLLKVEDLLSFQWRIALGDQQLTAQAFLKLVKQFSGIVKLNDQYVFFAENEIQSLIHKLENPPQVSSHQVLQIALTEDYQGAKVSLDKKTQALMQRLLGGEDVAVPEKLQATLRPYQKSGYEWLYKNTRIGFGSLIADDMGLGKTLQVIATLLRLQQDGELDKQKALVIVPTTLLTNWEKEIQRFAPDLKTHLYHGSKRDLEPLKEAHILLTTYGVARSETAVLQKKKWLLLVIDEAQNIKNPATAQTKAIKKIKAPVKIAMSGTPVENRLSEYWSIFDFTNQGYLGRLKDFKEEFAKPIELDRNQEKLDKFRKLTEPFILRRLKSDRSIIKDLPEKIEKDQFCQLTPSQTALYQNVVTTTMKAIKSAEGIERKGLVLKLLTALKQVCNHPTQFLKKGTVDPALSGKSQLLIELLREILANGEKTLIFTQYQEMGKLLAEMLEVEFGLEIPFLHGGVSRKGRDEMVERFQNERATRVMILSLKAGGTGLNLTAASNVIHYDLWWNPAVEAQATDRAYRIGQQRNVMVHRFITEHTFEEKINELLQTKKELANLTVSTGEKWIGEYADEELRELVKLK